MSTPRNDWRPMDSAPRDGERITLYVAGRGAFEGWWHVNFDGSEAYWMDDQDSEPDPVAWRPLLLGPFEKTVYCQCQGERVPTDRCDYCSDDWVDDDYEDPPLYIKGHLAGLTPEQLYKERDRQHRIHDMAVDRCEEINSPTIETASARARLVEHELKARGLDPHITPPEWIIETRATVRRLYRVMAGDEKQAEALSAGLQPYHEDDQDEETLKIIRAPEEEDADV